MNTKLRTDLDFRELIHTHEARISEELVRKLEDYKIAHTTPYKEAVIDVLRHQIQVLEARMDTLRDLEEDLDNGRYE